MAAARTAAAGSTGAASGTVDSVSARGNGAFIGASSGERKRASPSALSLGPDGLKPVPATLSLYGRGDGGHETSARPFRRGACACAPSMGALLWVKVLP